MEDEEEKRRRRKEQKKAKKERRAKVEMEEKKEKEEAAGGNIGYFVMRTPSVLDNSKQDDEDYRTHVQKPIKSDLGSRTISKNTQNRNPDQPLPWEKNSEGRSEEVKKLRERPEVTMKTGDSSEEEDAQFFDSVSTPSQQQRNKSMGVLYFCPLSYL